MLVERVENKMNSRFVSRSTDPGWCERHDPTHSRAKHTLLRANGIDVDFTRFEYENAQGKKRKGKMREGER